MRLEVADLLLGLTMKETLAPKMLLPALLLQFEMELRA